MEHARHRPGNGSVTGRVALGPFLRGLGVVAGVAFATCVTLQFGAADPPLTLFVFASLCLVAGAFAFVAASFPRRAAGSSRAGLGVVALLYALTLTSFAFSAGDWVHLLWNVEFPILGLLFCSGLLLVRVWPDERVPSSPTMRGPGGAPVVLLAFFVLAAVPIGVALAPMEPFPMGRTPGFDGVALVEAARYGFGGAIPDSMIPVGAKQAARGLGSPSRNVTVTMGALHFAAGAWTLFVLLAFAGRLAPRGEVRSRCYLLGPMLLMPYLTFVFPRGAWEAALWSNEPWVVAAFGPTLLTAAVATVALAVALRRAAVRVGGDAPRAGASDRDG